MFTKISARGVFSGFSGSSRLGFLYDLMILGLNVHSFYRRMLFLYCYCCNLASLACFSRSNSSVRNWMGTYAAPFFYFSSRIRFDWKEARYNLSCLAAYGLFSLFYLAFRAACPWLVYDCWTFCFVFFCATKRLLYVFYGFSSFLDKGLQLLDFSSEILTVCTAFSALIGEMDFLWSFSFPSTFLAMYWSKFITLLLFLSCLSLLSSLKEIYASPSSPIFWRVVNALSN